MSSLTADLVAKVTESWVALGHRASSIKSLDLYIKPEDMAAYYVINGKESGKIALLYVYLFAENSIQTR